MSNQTTPLSSGNLNGQTLMFELVEPGNDLPNAVAIRWPQKPTITSPATFDKVVADAMKILSNAVVELAALRVWKSCERPPRRGATVTDMSDIRNPDPEPMAAAERMRRHRARQRGNDVPKAKPGPKPRKPQTLREASLEELIDEISDRLTGRMADDPEIRELAFRGVVHSYQTSGDLLSFVSIQPFATE